MTQHSLQQRLSNIGVYEGRILLSCGPVTKLCPTALSSIKDDNCY